MIYFILLMIGTFGFTAMVLLGSLHGHGDHGGGHHGHGHAHDVGDFAHGHVAAGHHLGHAAAHGKFAHSKFAGGKGFRASKFLLLSPMDLFALALGAGATGLLAAPLLNEPFLAIAALVGGLFLNYLMVRPLMGVFLRFVSRPSEGLEGMLAHEAEAVTAFDKSGRGLVKVVLDDEIIQILGALEPAEHEAGVAVKRGDRLTIVEIDPKRNVCRVSRELAAQMPSASS